MGSTKRKKFFKIPKIPIMDGQPNHGGMPEMP